MPKGDATCPLGFHPQFRRPTYCKRCFREYSEHKSAKEGSSTSINSVSYERKDDPYGSRDSLVSTSRLKAESEGLSRSRSDLSSNSFSRSSSVDEDKGSWGKARPMSWSAQDLRKAVDDAKETTRTSREEISIPTYTHKVYGSTRSLTQDLGVLAHNRDSYSSTDTSSKEAESTSKSNLMDVPKTPSFSNYLAMRTKSPARPPLNKSTSLQGTSSTLSPHLEEEEYTYSKHKSLKPESNSLTGGEPKTFSITSKSALDVRPPKAPGRAEKVSRLPDLQEVAESRSEKSKRIIQSLREVKSEDADATYVIQLTPRSKKEKEVTPTPSKKVEIDLQSEVERLQKEIKELTKQNNQLTETTDQLQRENNELLAKKPRFGDLRKQTENTKLQAKIDELSEEIKKKNKEVKDAKKELDKRPMPKDVEKTMEDLRSKLQAAEQLCEELMDENEDYKKEVRTLEDEIEEMQDNFREEQADEYRDLKRELEQRAKDCRVLQFKLKKAERKSDSLERDKEECEEKLKELQVAESDVERAEKMKTLEKELNLAKDVSMKMHEEMEKMKNQLHEAETDKEKLKERVHEAPLRPGSKVSRQQMMGRQGSQDNSDQILRDLHDSLEREQDLKEQLRFAEEETKNFRKKLSRVEEENESLQLQLNKMSTKAKQIRQKSLERQGSLEGTVERGTLSRQGSTEKPPQPPVVNGEEVDPTELKIQLELNEQEAAVLRRKVEDLESENLRLQRELREILSSSDYKKLDYSNVPDVSKDNIYFSNKIKLLEQELNDLRKKIIDSTKEKDQLRSELEASKRRARLTKSRSQEQAEAEESKKQELLIKESEALKTKLIELQDQNDKLIDENKRLYLKTQKRIPLSTQENLNIEKQVLEDKVKRLEKRLREAQVKNSDLTKDPSGASDQRILDLQSLVDSLQSQCSSLVKENEEMKRTSGYGERTPKVPKDITPKSTLIKWVVELEKECATLHVALKEAEGKRPPSIKVDEGKSLRDKLEREKERIEELTRQLMEERLKNDKTSQKRVNGSAAREDDLRRYEDRIDSLKKELKEEKEKFDQLKKQLSGGALVHFDELRTAQTEKHKLQKELASRQQIISVLERKLKESEETLKISEKSERNLRNLLEKAEFRLEEEKNSQSSLEGRQKDMTMSWLKERDDLKKEVTTIKKARDSLEKEVRQCDRMIKNLETQLQTERKLVDEQEGKAKNEKEDLRKLKKENDNLQIELDELKDTVNRLEKEKKKINSKEKDLEQLQKDKEDLEIRMTTLETELKTEKAKRGRLESDMARGIKGQTSEIVEYKDRVQNLERLTSDLEFSNRELENKTKALEKQLCKEKKDLENLQNKYDLLEEDYVVQKAHSSVNGNGGSDVSLLKKEYETAKDELRALRNTYNNHRDNWIKEKLDMQIQQKELEEQYKKNGDNGLFAEKLRLRNIIDDKNQNLENLKGELETLKDQLAYYRREAEDLRRKADDLEKLQDLADKRQNSSSVDTKGYESTIKDLRSRLTALEKTNKSDITKMKMRYDTKIKALSDELSTVTQHMSKYRRERDTYKEMLDGAQRTIADLKGGTASTYRLSKADNATEAKAHLTEVHDLQSAMTELEDKLADSRLAITKLKNEIVDQKTNYEIHISDMQTKLNEYEEDRLLGGGGRRVPGLRTRLELNWQKEREEQTRLIHETATLAKDLRQTLYEVERERDMERLEGKRKIDQLKRTVTQDHHDTKSKVQELQRDLLELREAHAKLRQINEKLRREKDRTEVEREAMRDKFLGSSREHLNQQSRMERMLEEVKKVKDLSPLVLGETIDGRGAAETKLPSEPKPRTKEEFVEALRKLNKTSEELRIMMSLGDDRDRLRRTPSFRRALSTESDDEGPSGRSHSAGRRGSHRPVPRGQKSQLYRKSQSLDHQLAEDSRGKIWVSTDAGSTSSIESSATDDMRRAKYDLDRSMDRISTGSQTSDMEAPPSGSGGEQKKKGIKGVFSKFGKSKSIEDTSTGGTIVGVGLQVLAPGLTGSGSSLTSETEKEGSVKGKLKTLFSTKKAPPSKTNSFEKDGPSVKSLSSKFEEDPPTGASNTSLNSLSRNDNLPPVLRRLQGGNKFSSSGQMAKARSFSTLGRTPSQETDV